MQIKAIILDLDNTIYPVSSIGYRLFPPLFQLIKSRINAPEQLPLIEQDIMRKPFQWVAKEYHFDELLTADCMKLLTDLTYQQPIDCFPDYKELEQISCSKFLVTMGFIKMQKSKVLSLGIEKDFKQVYIIDPAISTFVKKDIFSQILSEYNYSPSEVMVIGDDPHSEIRAGLELGMVSVVYDRNHQYNHLTELHRIADFREILPYFRV